MKKLYTLLFIGILFGKTSFAQTVIQNENFQGFDKTTDNTGEDSRTGNASFHAISFEQSVNLYPTPTTGLLNIIFSDGLISNPIINVYNLIGSKITCQVDHVSASRYTINLSEQRPGLYLVKVQTSQGILTRRITVK